MAQKNFFLNLRQTKKLAIGLATVITAIFAVFLWSFVERIWDVISLGTICISIELFSYLLLYAFLGGWDKEKYENFAKKLFKKEYIPVYFDPQNPDTLDSLTRNVVYYKKWNETYYAKLIDDGNKISMSIRNTENQLQFVGEISIDSFINNFKAIS